MYSLSIILNLHQEKYLLTKTIHNLQHILSCTSSWHKIEVIAILDKSDEETKSIVYAHQNIFDKIKEVRFGDLALSRNYGVKHSTCNFVLFADGDDYCSHNLLTALYKVFKRHYGRATTINHLKDTEHIAVFAKHLIWFPNISSMHYVDSNEIMVQNNKFIHCYNSKIAICRNLLLKYPLRPNASPYGYEDWDLNNRLLHSGVQFKVAEYTLYYRKENHTSLLAKQIEKNYIVRNSNAYMLHNIKTEFSPVILTQENKKDLFSRLQTFIHKFTHTNKPISLTKDLLFLQKYNESYVTSDIHFHSAQHYRHHLSNEVYIYKKLLILLKNNQYPHIFHFNLSKEIPNWDILSQTQHFHIIIKALLNSEATKLQLPHSHIIAKVFTDYKDIFINKNIDINLI